MLRSTHTTRTAPTRRRRLAVGALAVSLLAVGGAACSSSGSSANDGSSTTTAAANGFDPATYRGLSATLKGSGSTFQQNYDNAVIKTLTGVVPGVTFNYAGGGSGQGKSDLADGVVDFAGTDSLVKPQDLAKYPGGILYFPTVVAPITVSYELDGVKELKLDGPTLAKIFTAKVTTWDDASIAALNAGATLPATPITVCHRSDASGTTTNFSKYLASAGGPDWTLGSGDSLAWPAATHGADGNGGVAQCINGKTGTIGYVDLSDAKSQSLTFASIKNKVGEFVQPTLAGASAAAGAAEVADDLIYSPIDTAGKGVYPITSPTWVIVTKTQTDKAKATAVKMLLDFILTDGQDRSFTSSVNYAPLPKSLATKAIAQLEELQVP
jgi:phosphate transport system substrate-binding protein